MPVPLLGGGGAGATTTNLRLQAREQLHHRDSWNGCGLPMCCRSVHQRWLLWLLWLRQKQ